MPPTQALITFGMLNLAAAASPGPAFVLVSRTAAGAGRAPGLRVAAGTAAASVVWAFAALLGVEAILAQAGVLYRILQILGGLYLAYVGWQVWKSASGSLGEWGQAVSVAGFREGFLLGLSNPKVIIFFGSVFGIAFTPGTPTEVRWLALPVVLVVEFGWYCSLSVLFSSGPFRAVYARIKTGFERSCGAFLGFFGLRLASKAALE